MSIWSTIESYVNSGAKFIESLLGIVVESEVTALKPIATQLVANATTDITTAAATGKLSSLGAVLGTLITQTATQAEAAGIVAGVASLGTTVTAALAAHPAVVAIAAPSASAP